MTRQHFAEEEEDFSKGHLIFLQEAAKFAVTDAAFQRRFGDYGIQYLLSALDLIKSKLLNITD